MIICFMMTNNYLRFFTWIIILGVAYYLPPTFTICPFASVESKSGHLVCKLRLVHLPRLKLILYGILNYAHSHSFSQHLERRKFQSEVT